MPHNNTRPLLIVITGGIASGKSLVSNWFEQRGYRVIHADKIGHECLKEKEVIREIRKIFGTKVFDNDALNRRKLGQQVFENEDKMAKLNAILHPRIRKRMSKIIKNSKEQILFFEIPLLFENGLESCFDYIINVSAGKNNQIKRLLIRDQINKDEAISRINTQYLDEYKRNKADFVIENSGTLEDCFQQLVELENIVKNLGKKDIDSLENKQFPKRDC